MKQPKQAKTPRQNDRNNQKETTVTTKTNYHNMEIERTIYPWVRSGVDHNRNETNGIHLLSLTVFFSLNFGPYGDFVTVVSFRSSRFRRFGGFTCFGCFVSVVSFAVSGSSTGLRQFCPEQLRPLSTSSSTRFIVYVFSCLTYILCALTSVFMQQIFI